MEHLLPNLPHSLDALEPHMSRETLEYHHGRHQRSYIEKLNRQIKGSAFADMDLESVIKSNVSSNVFNNAAQAWNHNFFWISMKPNGGGAPGGALAHAISESWGDLAAFNSAFQESAVGNFGSGWTWLVKKPDGSLALVNTNGAGNPLTTDETPLLTIDVWEHAYYIDYRNARAKFVGAYLAHLVNWDFAAKCFA